MQTVAKLVDAGIDYVRITSEDVGVQNELYDAFMGVAKDDAKLGYKIIPGGAFGFMGKKTRHALWGEKKGWAMLQISGGAAKRSHLLAKPGSQAARLDLQLTYWVGEENVERTIRQAYNGACDCEDPSRKHMQVNLIESRRRAQTLYVGSRASDVFFRVYDKFEESGKEEYRGCVRFELELKGRMSKACWKKLVDFDTTLRAMLEMVISMLAARGISVPSDDLDNQDLLHLKKERTTLEGTLGWLSRQVAPAVSRISAEVGYYSPFVALFGEALTAIRQHRILSLIAISAGS